MPYLMAIDQGTSSSRALLFDLQGQLMFTAQKILRPFYPQPGWVEEDPMEILQSVFDVVQQAIHFARMESILGIGITNQRETTVLWDKKSGKPLYPAIVWQDRRTTAACEKILQDPFASMITRRTGLVIDPYFSATKIQWILQQNPEWKKRAQQGEICFGTVDSWLIWNLSGRKAHVIDVSNASRTLLMNLETLSWDPEILNFFQIPREMLPTIIPSAGLIEQARFPFHSSPIPLYAAIGDQQSALVGQAGFHPGMAKVTYGTGSFVLLHSGPTPPVSTHRLLSTVFYQQISQPASYAIEGSSFNSGTAVQWLRDEMGIIQQSSEISTLAQQVLSTEGVYFVPAFTGLGAPYWNPRSRGMLLGLTRGTRKAHIARAAIESMAFQVLDLLRTMESDIKRPIEQIRVDGGASRDDLLLQIQADLLQIPVARPMERESTSLGAALLTGLAAGIYRNEEEMARCWKIDRVFSPQISASEAAFRYEQWKKAVAVTMQWEGASSP